MRYDQYYLVHRLIENLVGEEEEGEGDFPHIGQIRFSNGSDKNKYPPLWKVLVVSLTTTGISLLYLLLLLFRITEDNYYCQIQESIEQLPLFTIVTAQPSQAKLKPSWAKTL